MNTPHEVEPLDLLRLTLRLLNDADEANHSGDYGTVALQRQAREILAEAIDQMTAGPDRIAEIERQLTIGTAGGNSLTIAEGSDLNSQDYELILRGLDVLDRDMQTELANKGQDAAAGETRSRILIVRSKLQQQRQAANDQASAKQLQTPKDGVGDAVKLLRNVNRELKGVCSSTYVCVGALQGQAGDEFAADAAVVLDSACAKLVLHVCWGVEEALKALGQDVGQDGGE